MEDNHEDKNIEQIPGGEADANLQHGINPGFVEASDKEFEKLAKEELQQHNESNEQDLSLTQMAKATVRFILKAIACILVLYVAYQILFYRPVKGNYGDRRVTACSANSRIIQSAIEFYNMGDSGLIKEVNDETLQLLVDGKCLQSLPKPPASDCKYKSYEKNDEVCVYCVVHGESGTHLINGQPSPYLAAKNAENKKGTIIAFAIPILLIIAAIWAFR